MSLKFFDKFSQDFTNLLTDEKYCDLTIEVGKNQNKKTFTAHSAVLHYRSSYFCAILSDTPERKHVTKKIFLPKITPQVFEIALRYFRYIYGGTVELKNADIKTIFDLMIASGDLMLIELSKKLETHLVENEPSWINSHLSYVYQLIFQHNSFKCLEDFCNDNIAKNPNIVFDSEDFTSFQESLLISIIKREDLRIEEVKIWENIILWGVVRNPTLSPNPEKWSGKDCMDLKNTLKHLLPHIRYFQISNADLWEKVKPYKEVLDEQLWNDLIQHRLLPDKPVRSIILPARLAYASEPRTSEPFSTILNDEHLAEISSWIERKSRTSPAMDMFQLILRGSRDGFDPKIFWKNCHGCSNTVTVLKVKGTEEILGGYNPLVWDKTTSGVWMETEKSFVFSLKNLTQNSIVSRVQKNGSNQAVFNASLVDQNRCGPYFGYALCMYTEASDFTRDKRNYCNQAWSSGYEREIRKTCESFSIVDYEVFRVI
ncbi:15802_t:CDS:2 [Acaulospora colombiana]|uniref:15802_t:CDS:1 n=1 Tax=Acaulospora colombiana TaxID=27376 RepID=A0ACA9L2C1_9GLOM|nr:15802_t:CDS:2 [Acaulospora colombiana]